MVETQPIRQDRVQIEVGPATIDCFVDGRFTRRVIGVGVKVSLDGESIWETREYPRFLESLIGYAPKPFYEARIQRARRKTDKIAKRLEASL